MKSCWLGSLGLIVVSTFAASGFAQSGSPRGVALLPGRLDDARRRSEQLRAIQARRAEDEKQKQELEKIDRLESAYWRLWKENLNTDIGDSNARPTNPTPQGMRDLMVAGRRLYQAYDQQVQAGEEALRSRGKDPEKDMDAGLRTLRAQRDMFDWTVTRPPQPPPVRWLTEAQIEQLGGQVARRYQEMKREIGAPLPLPAPDSIDLAGETHTKQETLDMFRGKSREQLQQEFDRMSAEMLKVLNVPELPPSAGPVAIREVATGTLEANALMLKSFRFYLAVLSEHLLGMREDKDVDDDVNALLQGMDSFLKNTDSLRQK